MADSMKRLVGPAGSSFASLRSGDHPNGIADTIAEPDDCG
jgi:hypothetical protein